MTTTPAQGRWEVMPVATATQQAQWDAFVQSHPHGRHFQLSWWLKYHDRWFARTRIIAVTESGEIVAGAGLYRFGLPIPGCCVTVITNAPLVRAGCEAALPTLLAALHGYCRRRGSILLQMEAFAPELNELIQRHFAGSTVQLEPIWKLYHPGIWREIRINLQYDGPEQLMKSFSRLVSRQVRKAEEAGVEVLEGCDEANIRLAHDVWSESAARKNYLIRTFDDFRRIVLASQRQGVAHLLVARVQSEPAGFLFSLLCGTAAVALHTGYTDKHADIPCNRLLHWRAMLTAMERGMPYFSLAAPGRGGVRQFKDHFHPDVLDNTRFVCVQLHPLLVRLARPFMGRTDWMQRLKGLVGRRIAPAGGES